MKTYEPTPKAIALREYQKAWTEYINYGRSPNRRSFLLYGTAEGCGNVAIALGATVEDLKLIRDIAEEIHRYENEKALQA